MILDPNAAYSETAEWNNATYLPIQVCRPFSVCPLPDLPEAPPIG